jgi:hypothetical protein
MQPQGVLGAPLTPDQRQVKKPPPSLQITTIFLVFHGLSHGTTLEKKCVAQNCICIFKNLRNYFLKLLCLLKKHKHCPVGKIYQFLTINQLK